MLGSCVCMLGAGGQGQRTMLGVLVYRFLTYSPETEFLIEFGTCCFSVTILMPLSSPEPWGLQVHTIRQLSHGCWGGNAGPPAYKASALPLSHLHDPSVRVFQGPNERILITCLIPRPLFLCF